MRRYRLLIDAPIKAHGVARRDVAWRGAAWRGAAGRRGGRALLLEVAMVSATSLAYWIARSSTNPAAAGGGGGGGAGDNMGVRRRRNSARPVCCVSGAHQSIPRAFHILGI